jgi:transcriptional regulator with XRE-family HTH domain
MCVVVRESNPEVVMSKGNGSPHAEPKIGRTLELARKEQGLSLHQVEQETKIRTRYLRELERENFDVLPAVYVQGSLKTYANFLGLDGEALTRELRRRQPPEDEPEAPTHIEPSKSDYLDRYLISVGGAVGSENGEVAEDEEIVGAKTVPANNYRLYLGSAAFLVLALVAAALVLTLPRDSQLAVSQVREPLISQAPSEVSRVSDEERNPVPQQENGESSDPKPRQQAGSPDEDASEDGGEPAHGSLDATATASATPAAETASAEPDATPAPSTEEPVAEEPVAEEPVAEEPVAEEPATTRPVPAASEAPVEEGQPVVGGLRARGPVQENDEGPVKNFSITRENNGRIGNSSCPRNDGGLVEIRRGQERC